MQVSLIRVFLLRILSIYAVLYALYRKTDLNQEQSPLYETGEVTQETCAGTVIGQELYKLVIVDTVTFLAGRSFTNFVLSRYWYVRCASFEFCGKKKRKKIQEM